MTPSDVAQVQKSFAELEKHSDQVVSLFYDRLFEIQPDLKFLFHVDFEEQKLKFMGMLGLIVIGLDKLETILPATRDLARRHAGYGVRTEHYAPVGAALLWALERQLGAAWTGRLAEAWAAAYATVSDDMIAAASGVERRGAP